MISSRELKLGKIALRRGMVDKAQIDQCLRLKKKLAETKGKKVALGALLLKKGYLSREQLEEIVAIHDKSASKSDGAKRSKRTKRASVNGTAAPEKEKRRSRRSSKQEDGEPRKSSSAKRESSTKRSSSRKRETGGKDAKRETSSAKRETSSAKRETSSAKRETSSAKRETSSAKRETSSAKRETSSTKRATGSRKRDTSSKDDARKRGERKEPSGKRSRSGSGKTATRSRSKRVGKESTTTRAKGKRARSDKAPSQNGAVDSAVFVSATESAVDEVDRRIVACPSCGKKYRVRPKQVGKRFNCRRCETKIKVPKDLFERALEPESNVDEFTLSGSDVLDSAELQAAAAVAQQSVKKVKSARSIADLAQAATGHKKKGLGPRTSFGAPQLITLAASLVLLVGVGYGLYWYSGSLAAEKVDALQAKVRNEFSDWETQLSAAVGEIDEAGSKLDAVAEKISKGVLPDADEGLAKQLDIALSEVATCRARLEELRSVRPSSSDNNAKAVAREAELEVDPKLRSVLSRQALVYRALGGYQIDNAIDALKAAAAVDTTHVQSQLDLAALLISVRRTGPALETLGKLEGEGANALNALATELGGNASAAAKTYGALSDPLGKVLAARAYLTQGDAKQAIDRLSGLNLEGEELAVAKLIEGYAAEAAGRDASRPYGDAIDATDSSPFPRIARGEYYVRIGKPKLAAADFLAANRSVPTARGYLGLGDANVCLMDLEKAQRNYAQAIKLALKPKDMRLVAGQVDPYTRPLTADPRSMARVRQGMLAWMQGKPAEGRTHFQSARVLDPFNPMALAAQAHLELLTKSGSPEIPAFIQEASKLCSGLSAEAGDRALLPTPAAAYVLLVRAAMEVNAGQPEEADLSLTASERCLGAEKGAIASLRVQLYQSQGRDSLAYKEAARMTEAETNERTEIGRIYQAAAKTVASVDPENRTSVERAQTGILACLVRNPYHVNARVLLAKLSIAAKEFDTAIATLQRAEEINPYHRELYVVRGFLNVRDLPEARLTRESKEQAAKDFAFALDLEQRSGGPHAETLYGQALVSYQQRRLLDAQQKIRACLEVDTKFAKAYQLRAQVLRNLNKPGADEAQATYESLSKGG